jgi:hypothetical protein
MEERLSRGSRDNRLLLHSHRHPSHRHPSSQRNSSQRNSSLNNNLCRIKPKSRRPPGGSRNF